MPLTSELPSLVLVWPSNWGSWSLIGEDGGQALAAVVAGDVLAEVLEEVVAAGVGVEGAGQRGLEADEVGAALGRVDVVDEGQDRLGVGHVVLDGQVDADALPLALEHDRLGIDGLLVLVEVFDELADAALVLEIVGLVGPLVDDGDPEPFVQERELAQALGQDVEIVFRDLVEDLLVGPEGDLGPRLLGLADLLELRDGIAALVALGVDAALALDLEVEPFRERVDDGDADAVEAAGDLVALLIELAAGMEDGHDDFGRRLVLLLVQADGDAAPVVDDGDGIVDVDEDVDLGAVAGQGLVDAVVDDLVNEVVEALRPGAADVHGRALADGLEALQDLDAFSGILFLCHVRSLIKKCRFPARARHGIRWPFFKIILYQKMGLSSKKYLRFS